MILMPHLAWPEVENVICVQAIDLIDEAGSRVRLRHAQLPEEARDLDKELRALLKEKDAAVRGQVGTSARRSYL